MTAPALLVPTIRAALEGAADGEPCATCHQQASQALSGRLHPTCAARIARGWLAALLDQVAERGDGS